MDEQDAALFRLTFADEQGAADLVEELLQDSELDVAHQNDDFSEDAREAGKSMLSQDSEGQTAERHVEYLEMEPPYDIDSFEGTVQLSYEYNFASKLTSVRKNGS